MELKAFILRPLQLSKPQVIDCSELWLDLLFLLQFFQFFLFMTIQAGVRVDLLG